MIKKPRNYNIRLEDFITEDHFWAIQNLFQGTATAAQQKIAAKVIAENIAGFYQVSYDPESNSNTIFNEGRRWVARFLFEISTASKTYFKELERPKKKPNINNPI